MAAFVLGLSSTAMVDGAEVALVDLAGDDLRKYLARSNVLATIGDLLGPAIIAVVAVAGLSWRLAFAVGSVLLALYGVALAAAPLPGPANKGNGGEDEGRPGLAGVLRDPAVWSIGLISMLMGPFDEPLIGFTIALLEQERGASAAAATIVAFVGVSGGLLAFTVLARRFQDVADHRLLVASVSAMTAGAAAIAFVPVLAVVAAAALVTSVGLSLAWLAVQHRSLTVRPGQVGTTKAVVGTIETTGFWIPVAIGAVADRGGLHLAVACYAVLGAAMIALSAVSRRGSRARDRAGRVG